MNQPLPHLSYLHEWKANGEEITAKMIARYEAKLGTNRTFWDKKWDNKKTDTKSADTSYTDTETESDSQEDEVERLMRVPRFGLRGKVRKRPGE